MKVPKIFWTNAVSTTCFLSNRMPSILLVGDMPCNILFSKQVIISNGTKDIWKHVLMFEMFSHMLDPKALKCAFLGYSRFTKGINTILLNLAKDLRQIKCFLIGEPLARVKTMLINYTNMPHMQVQQNVVYYF